MQVTTYRKPLNQPTLFLSRHTGGSTPHFTPGDSSCKICGSTTLDYYAYLDDAKCTCGQWQNEEPLAL